MRTFIILLFWSAVISCSSSHQTSISTGTQNESVTRSSVTFDLQKNHFKSFNAMSPSRIMKDYSVRKYGSYSYRFDLLPDDTSNENSKKTEFVGIVGNDNKEILEQEGNKSYYAFSFMVDSNWTSPVGHAGNPDHATILQWKSYDLPVVVFMVFGEDVVLRVNWAKGDYPIGAYYTVKPLKRGIWLDFYFIINFSYSNGSIVILNEKKDTLVNVKAPTIEAKPLPLQIHTGIYTGQDSVFYRLWVGKLTKAGNLNDLK